MHILNITQTPNNIYILRLLISPFLSLFQGLTGPDGPAGKDGPAGEGVSVSQSIPHSTLLSLNVKAHPIEL